jgi:uncharacterized lipoprotein YddW (UPF0748 family)
VLLGDDADQKSYALLCLVGHVVPDVWTSAAEGALAQAGRVGPYLDYTEAVSGIRGQASVTLRASLVESNLGWADAARATAQQHLSASNYPQAIFSAQTVRQHLRRAYLLGLRSAAPEFRALWEHHGTGPNAGNWGAGLDALVTNGFNAIVPNLLWGGLAHYNSAYLPLSSEYLIYGDQVAACVQAARARGLQVHVWKVNWNLLGAPQSFIDSLRAANRTQVSRYGTNTDWLCPSHPDNFALETNSLLEVVRNYDVDGIHFDYIRYPDGDHCYCTGCRTRFQTQTGLTVANWPADVLAAGSLRTSFLNWRRAQITRLVDAVHAGAKASKPGVKISAAVFPDAPGAYDGVGQDWRLWVTNRLLDFVCPMDYTTDLYRFTNLVTQQLGFVANRIPVYPGIGSYVLESDQTAAQIQATRQLNTGGFILFELSPSAIAGLMPDLRLGVTAPDEPDTDRDLLPDSWELRWFGHLNSKPGEDADQDGLPNSDEYVAGTDPRQPASRVALRIQTMSNALALEFSALATDSPGYQNAARYYRVEYGNSLTTNQWQPLAGFERVMPPLSGSLLASVPLSASTGDEPRWYRLRVWLEQKP